MSKTKENHYSPKFANKYWANNNGLMVKYTKGLTGQLKKSRTGPVEWGQESYLYPQNIEDALARFERTIAPIYKKLLENQPPSLYERLLWSHWILCQYSRTPSFIIDFAKFEEDLRAYFSRFIDNLGIAINAEEKLQSALYNIVTTSTNKELIPFLAVRDWVICEAADGFCFPRSDSPLILTGPLVRENTQIIYPLSPKHCFVALVIGGFPPSAFFFTDQLSSNDSLQCLKLIANKTDRELVVHPDDDTSELRAILQDSFGDNAGYFSIGAVPDLRYV